jgi:glucosamine kinase
MLLIVDSGGTKTHWRLLKDQHNFESLNTPGINPYYQNSEQIYKDLKDNLTHEITGHMVQKIFFYGAGCSVKEKQEIVGTALQMVFKKADIVVDGDLLGTARALCHNNPGIACVIGTGSGSSLYDGKKIIANIASLGYILGDEGSGAYLGKRLLQDYLRGDMPQKIITKLRSEFEISKEIVLENVNRRPMPSRYLGSFSEFIKANLSNEYLRDLVHNSFKDFVSRYIIKYPDYTKYQVHFAGSIAYHFSECLRKVLADHNITAGEIINSPMDGLMKYHLERLK